MFRGGAAKLGGHSNRWALINYEGVSMEDREVSMSELLCNGTLGKFILPKWGDGKDMIPLGK